MDMDIDMDAGDFDRRFSVMNYDTGQMEQLDMCDDEGGDGASDRKVPDTPTSFDFNPGERVACRIVNRGVVNDNVRKAHTVYVISVWRETRPRQPWAVYRRYNEFSELNDSLRRMGLVTGTFPGKKMLGVFEESFLNKRQTGLARWLDTVVQTYSALNEHDRAQLEVVKTFLTRDANVKPQGFGRRKGEAAAAAAAAAAPPAPRKPKVGLHSFKLLKVIGKGSFGKVVLAKKKDTGQVYAMKILAKQTVVKRKQVEHTKTERRVLGYTKHPNIVSLHYAFQSRSKLYFVLDYCAGGELFFHLGRLGRFKEDMACFYTAQLVLAIGHLHKLKVVYRDMKPENVLLDDKGNIKIADFGLSKEGIAHSTSGTGSFCGTPEYLAPEILARRGHGTAVDWWSLGMILFEMLTGLPPWYTRDRKQLYESIRAAPLTVPNYVSPLAVSVLKGLLERNPAKRLGGGPRDAAEVMEHPWFAGIDWDKMKRGELTPVFLPRMNGSTDTRYFDKEFTRLPVTDELGQSVPTAGAQPSFPDFTFMTPSELSSRMRRASYLDTSVSPGGAPVATTARMSPDDMDLGVGGGNSAGMGALAGAGAGAGAGSGAGYVPSNAQPLQGTMAGGWGGRGAPAGQ